MQELALARDLTLAYGLRSVSFGWHSPASLAIQAMGRIDNLEAAHPEIPLFLGRRTWLLLANKMLVDWSMMGKIAGIQHAVPLRKRETDPMDTKARSWSTFCCLAYSLHTSDPRDHIYALLGLT